MKKLKNALLFSFGFLLTASTQASLLGGESSAGGGNTSVYEFKAIGALCIESLTQQGTLSLQGRIIDLNLMGESLGKALIEVSRRPLYLRGAPVDAINYPNEGRIVINELRWKKASSDAKVGIVLHELWGLTFADDKDNNYSFSQAMAKHVRTASFENPTKVISLLSTPQDGRGQTFRAVVIRTGTEMNSNLRLVIQKLIQNDDVDIITDSIAYSPEQLPYGVDSSISGLRKYSNPQSADDGFEFDVISRLGSGPDLVCRFGLPDPPAIGPLPRQTLQCSKKKLRF